MTIKKYTSAQIKQLPDLTDWDRVKKTRDTDIDFTDAPMATPAMLAQAVYPNRGRPIKENKKKSVTLRMDAELVEAFQSTGPGWQTRINDALRHIVSLRGLL